MKRLTVGRVLMVWTSALMAAFQVYHVACLPPGTADPADRSYYVQVAVSSKSEQALAPATNETDDATADGGADVYDPNAAPEFEVTHERAKRCPCCCCGDDDGGGGDQPIIIVMGMMGTSIIRLRSERRRDRFGFREREEAPIVVVGGMQQNSGVQVIDGNQPQVIHARRRRRTQGKPTAPIAAPQKPAAPAPVVTQPIITGKPYKLDPYYAKIQRDHFEGADSKMIGQECQATAQCPDGAICSDALGHESSLCFCERGGPSFYPDGRQYCTNQLIPNGSNTPFFGYSAHFINGKGSPPPPSELAALLANSSTPSAPLGSTQPPKLGAQKLPKKETKPSKYSQTSDGLQMQQPNRKITARPQQQQSAQKAKEESKRQELSADHSSVLRQQLAQQKEQQQQHGNYKQSYKQNNLNENGNKQDIGGVPAKQSAAIHEYQTIGQPISVKELPKIVIMPNECECPSFCSEKANSFSGLPVEQQQQQHTKQQQNKATLAEGIQQGQRIPKSAAPNQENPIASSPVSEVDHAIATEETKPTAATTTKGTLKPSFQILLNEIKQLITKSAVNRKNNQTTTQRPNTVLRQQ